MALASTTIATAIKNLSITGVTVLDITEMQDQVDLRLGPVLMPGPSWIAGGLGGEDPEGSATFGPGMWIFQRVFSYRYFHAPVGSGRGLYDYYSAMSTNLDAIVTAFVGLNVTGVDVMELDNSEFMVVNDPSEKQFYGFDFAVSLKEKVNP